MQELFRIQSAFLDEVFNEDKTSKLTPIKANLGVTSRLSIYRNNQVLGLTNALENIYAVCYKLVGRRAFEFLARHYIREHPSYTKNLKDYGGSFPEFIVNFEPAKVLPYLSDIAQLEWFSHEILLGSDAKAFDWQALSVVSPQEQAAICFYRSPLSQLYSSSYPIDRIFEVNQPGYQEAHDPILLDECVYLYIGRDGYDLKIQRLSEIEWKILNVLGADMTLTQLSQLPIITENQIDLTVLLPDLIQRELIAGFCIAA